MSEGIGKRTNRTKGKKDYNEQSNTGARSKTFRGQAGSAPACGTGGFLLAAYDFILDNHNLDKAQKEFLKNQTFSGNEIVANTRRLVLMNMFLHNIGELTGEPMISSTDSLIADTGARFDYVFANPPFGKKSSMTFTNEKGEQKKEAPDL